jgi:hypothetical protein
VKRHGDNPTLPPGRFGGKRLASQSWKWLTEPFAIADLMAPPVGLVFGEELPQLPNRNEKFVDP